jgi:hypothetical protein
MDVKNHQWKYAIKRREKTIRYSRMVKKWSGRAVVVTTAAGE